MASPVQVAAHNDRGAESADLIEIVVLDLTSWSHLLTARQPRCDHWGAPTKAPWLHQLRDKEIPSLFKRGKYVSLNAPSSPSAGRFQFPAPDSHQLTGFARIAFSHQLQAVRAYLVNSLRSAPSYRTVVRLRKPRPAGGHAGCGHEHANVARISLVNPTRMAGDDHHSRRLIALS